MCCDFGRRISDGASHTAQVWDCSHMFWSYNFQNMMPVVPHRTCDLPKKTSNGLKIRMPKLQDILILHFTFLQVLFCGFMIVQYVNCTCRTWRTQ